MPKADPVNHPAHYTQGKVEVIEAIEDWKIGFHEGNVVKYVARAEHKGNQLEDLKKARWYLDRRIRELGGGPAPIEGLEEAIGSLFIINDGSGQEADRLVLMSKGNKREHGGWGKKPAIDYVKQQLGIGDGA